jgi:hypothetical protein
MLIEASGPLIAQCHVIGVVAKKNPKYQYKLKNLFYLPSTSFTDD